MTTPLPRDEFGVTSRCVYLNHAAVGVLPRTSARELHAFLDAHANGGVLGTWPYEARMPQWRTAIGRFIGASGDEIAILPNTSAGANAVAAGIDWKAGDEVVLGGNEFPANAIPWTSLQRRGVGIRRIDTERERLTPDVLRREIGPRTRAVAVSWVSYADGYRHDLAALREAARGSGALLCVDAIQGLGAFPLDVRSTGVDVLYCGAAKWMLGLQGAAFLYVRRELIDALHLGSPGWRSMLDMWDFANWEQPYAREALRFEGGTPSFLGALSLAVSIDLFERCGGPAAIAPHVLALTDRLCEGLSRLGASIASPRGGGVSSGIVTFSLPGVDSVALGRALQEGEGVVTTFRASGIRVSPHGYNTAEEIDRLLAAIAQYASATAAKR